MNLTSVCFESPRHCPIHCFVVVLIEQGWAWCRLIWLVAKVRFSFFCSSRANLETSNQFTSTPPFSTWMAFMSIPDTVLFQPSYSGHCDHGPQDRWAAAQPSVMEHVSRSKTIDQWQLSVSVPLRWWTPTNVIVCFLSSCATWACQMRDFMVTWPLLALQNLTTENYGK